MSLFSALLLFLLFPLVSRSQVSIGDMIGEDGSEPVSGDSSAPQRIGIPPQSHPGTEGFDLSMNETRSVMGFCFDEYLIAARRPTPFQHVLAGKNDATVRTADGRTFTMQEAIDKGLLAVNDFQLNISFTNRSKGPLSIRIDHPIVLWDRAAGDVNPAALAVLESPNDDYEWRQENVWRVTTAERRLGVLGYHDGSVWNIDRNQFTSDLASFQRAHNLQATGTLDDATIDQLASLDNTLRGRLRSLGFRDREGRSMKEDLAAQIRAYQRYTATKPSGSWSLDMLMQLNSDEQLVAGLNTIRSTGKSLGEMLAKSPSNVTTCLNGPKGMMALVESPKGIDLWGRQNGSYQWVARGRDAVRSMDAAASALAQKATKGNRIVIYPHVGNTSKVSLGVGSQVVETDISSMAEFLNGGAVPPELDEVLSGLVAMNSSPSTGDVVLPKVVVYRGPFVQGRSPETESSMLSRLKLNQIDGAKLATALESSYGTRASLYVSDDLRVDARSIRSELENQGELNSMRVRDHLMAGRALTH